MKKRQWADISNEEISFEAIRTLHTPANAYKVSPNSCDAGVKCPELFSVPTTVYVLAGNCKYKIGNDEKSLQASDVLEIEAGRYEFEVIGDTAVKLVNVFTLPPALWKPAK